MSRVDSSTLLIDMTDWEYLEKEVYAKVGLGVA